jgi:pimeloyl-ACP methyl ester carboxylesterase
MSSYLMIPGAGGAAWFWHRVVPLLEDAGHEAIAIDLPGPDPAAGLPEYTEIALAAADGRTDVVLAAQSMGGFTAPLVAARRPLKALVMVNAMIPVPGETAGQWWENTGWEEARVQAAKEGGYGTEFDLDTYFLHDVPPEVFAGAPAPRDESEAAFGSPCDFTAWPDIPIHAVAGRDDRFFPTEFQRRLAKDRLGVEADVLPGGHLIALAQPEPLARYLLEL